MKRFSTLPILLILLAIGAPLRAETLQQALVDAYRQNPTLLAKRASLRATDEEIAIAKSGYRPSLSAGTSVGAEQQRGDGDRSNLTPRGASFDVVQPIFRGGRTAAGITRAEYTVQSENQSLLDTEQNTLLDAVTAYTDVLQNRAVLELNRNNEMVLTRQYQATQDQFSVGELTRTDVAQSQSRQARAKADVISAEGILSSSQNQFLKIIGRLPGQDLDTPNLAPDLPPARDMAISLAQAQNPLLLSAQYLERAARANIDEVRGEEMPQVNLLGSAASDWDQFDNQDGRVDSLSVMAQLTFPFYQGGAVMARTRAAGETASQYQLQSAAAHREVSERAAKAWDDLSTAHANIEALRSAVDAASIALDGVRQEREVGSRTVLDVLDAEQELLNAKVSLVRARRDEIVASYALLASVGRLTAANLKLPVELYQPQKHYEKSKNSWFGYSPVNGGSER